MPDTALVIMARAPRVGKVKTRLAASLGPVPTLCLYRAFLTDLARRFATDHNCDLYWAYMPATIDFSVELAQLVPDLLTGTCFPQRGSNLADRLHQVFHTMAARSLPKTIVIGSDSPQISCALISQARLALEKSDVVLGPADDGGYYLIGMREPHDLFTDIPMSTPQVLQMTIDRARELSLSVHLLETLFDIDELPDFLRLARVLQDNPGLAPASAACITQLMKEFV